MKTQDELVWMIDRNPLGESLMKKTVGAVWSVLFMLVLALFSGAAFAQEALPSEVEALFQAAVPSGTITLFDQCGFTAAAVLRDDQNQTLCLAEQKNGVWELAVCNPAALRPDAPVTSLLLDTDETLFWSYNTYGKVVDTYHAVRIDGQWRTVSLMTSETNDDGEISEYHLSYGAGRLHYSTYFCDENENILSADSFLPVPAAWLEEWMPLNRYDDSRFPKPHRYYTHSWLPEDATALAAAELFPGDTFLGGCAGKEHLEFFLQSPNGERVIASCRLDKMDNWIITLSTPLPEGTTYGCENFSSSLVIGDLLVSIGPVDENNCGVTFIYNVADSVSGVPMFSLGQNWITGEITNGYHNCFGDHPWADITVIDWNSLPHSLEEALAIMDTSGWAVVHNPDPADRLHLRANPDRGAKSLGKYYNGTPLRILESKGDWVRVDIFGVSGWMMKQYLAFGRAGHAVEAVFPSRIPVDPYVHHYVYADYESQQHGFCSACRQIAEAVVVLGVVDEKWYHVWFPDGDLTGYVLQSDWYEGNG